MRKTVVLCMTIVLMLTLAVGCASQKEEGNTSPAKETGTVPAPETTKAVEPGSVKEQTFTMLTESHPTWPYQKDWLIWDMYKEKTGVTLDVQLPSGKLPETLNLVIASGNMPDLMYMTTHADANRFGEQGALVNILDYVDSMPNFKAWMEKYPAAAEQAMSADGKMYMFPNEGFGETNRMIWLYREDVFKKHNLNVPTNYDELYDVLKQLKELYPDSYPLAWRDGLDKLLNMGPAFQTWYKEYYDFDKNEWRYGPTEDSYKEAVQYLHKFYKDGLIPPEWLSIDTKQWQDIVSTNKAFITIDYIGRIDFFNSALRPENPEFNMAFMEPPAGPNGKQLNASVHFLETGLTVASTSKKIPEVMKFMDFYYTEEAREMASWGKEGVTFTKENGIKKIVPEYKEIGELRTKTGLATDGAYTWIDYDAHLSMATPELQEAYKQARKFDAPFQPNPALNQKESEVISLTGEAIEKHREENIAQFIFGNKSFDKWDDYVNEANKLGVDKILEIYTNAYERIRK
ncbi:extracellular solute-binding protein [Paenibacillus sp. GXUN7292]|uniref:extracellular solute-binding protein n=1 Tax=Paenibacillus sp. GXUN7292 TaxID=3422499 RepID=UPI003D7C5006